jgi:hypothetical protein
MTTKASEGYQLDPLLPSYKDFVRRRHRSSQLKVLEALTHELPGVLKRMQRGGVESHGGTS